MNDDVKKIFESAMDDLRSSVSKLNDNLKEDSFVLDGLIATSDVMNKFEKVARIMSDFKSEHFSQLAKIESNPLKQKIVGFDEAAIQKRGRPKKGVDA